MGRKGNGRKPSSRSLAELAAEIMSPIVEKNGLASAQILMRWPELAGPSLAGVTMPLRVNWPRQEEGTGNPAASSHHKGAVLVVGCESAHALDLQFAAPSIIERVNLVIGWQAIRRLSIRQGPVAQRKDEVPPPNLPDPPADLVKNLGNVDDEELRQALHRLASGIAAKRPGS